MARAPRSGRRAYTLLEVLIALALLVCIASLALPSMLGAGERMSFEQSCEQVKAWTLVARAEAQVRGQLLELAEAHQGSGRSKLIVRPARSSMQPDQTETPVDEWRQTLGELGPGLRAARARPVREDTPRQTPDEASESTEPRFTRLLLIRPDGSVDDGGGFHIWSADWRCVRVTARSLTGVLDLSPVELTADTVAPTSGESAVPAGGGEVPGEN